MKKHMRRALSFLLITVLMLTLVACGGGTKKETPLVDTATKFFEAIKVGDFKTAAQFVEDAKGFEDSNLNRAEMEEELGKENVAALFEIMGDVKISEAQETINGDKGTLKAKFESKDLSAAFTTFMSKSMEFSMSEEAQNLDEEAATKKMMDMFSEIIKDVKPTVKEGEIQFVKSGDTWKISKDNPFMTTLMTGGMSL